jgi:hypothetical protein
MALQIATIRASLISAFIGSSSRPFDPVWGRANGQLKQLPSPTSKEKTERDSARQHFGGRNPERLASTGPIKTDIRQRAAESIKICTDFSLLTSWNAFRAFR